LPYPNADRIVTVSGGLAVKGLEDIGASPPEFFDYRNQARLFEQVAAYATISSTLTGAGEPERINATLASASIFPLLGVEPTAGRAFLAEEDQDGNDNVVIISHRQWARRFNSDPNVAGQKLRLNGKNYTIIGVMPRGLEFPDQTPDVWLPMALSSEQSSEKERGSHWMKVVGLLKPGVTIEQARAEMNAIAAEMQRQHPEAYTADSGWKIDVRTMHESVVGDVKSALILILCAVGFVLLIACANVANLQLARTAARQREIAVRAALGASRARLIRQMLTESLLLSLLGGALGLLIAHTGKDLLIAFAPTDMPRLNEVSLDGSVIAFSLIVSILSGVLFGIAPALQSSKTDLVGSLKEAGTRSTESPGRHRLRGALVISEVALALILLIGAGLMIKSLIRLQQIDPGFEPENVVTMRLSLPQARYNEAGKQRAFYGQALEKIKTLPGVRSASAVNFLPLSATGNQRNFSIKGQGEMQTNLEFRMIDPGYLRTMQIALLAGRELNERDTASEPYVAVINETFARLFFADEDPLGKEIKLHGMNSPFPWLSVVGVVKDVKHGGLDVETRPEMYVSYLQPPLPNFAVQSMFLVVRTANDPLNIVDAIRKEVQSLDTELPVYSVATMEQLMARSLAPRRFNMFLFELFAVVALVLALVGIYGVLSYSVSQRTHEIGIRMAIGARGRDILSLIIRQAFTLVAIGVLLGGAGAYILTRFMTSLLFDVSATDPATFIAVSLLLASVAALASYLPARKAMKVDPLIALRYE
ncbi:MAG TPA: ABC transporter permease, partial [Blastocatellia bacterium]|nr:ABC transporter permease [Blastocatellia bacterium]